MRLTRQKQKAVIASRAAARRSSAGFSETKHRHREPRSGVAIQCTVQWIASSAAASSH
jgi:hypothetical protein